MWVVEPYPFITANCVICDSTLSSRMISIDLSCRRFHSREYFQKDLIYDQYSICMKYAIFQLWKWTAIVIMKNGNSLIHYIIALMKFKNYRWLMSMYISIRSALIEMVVSGRFRSEGFSILIPLHVLVGFHNSVLTVDCHAYI